MDSMRRNAQKMMPHVMALNKKPTMGMKNDRQPAPAVSKLVAFAKGGKVMAKGGAFNMKAEMKADMKQDKAMLARHNRLMHPGQKSKLKSGGMVKKYADGGKTNPFALKFEKERDEPVKSLKGEEPKKPSAEEKKEMPVKPPVKKAKGGKVKAKGDKKKVMGTVGEAKAVMAALQKARRPATPMPGTRMAGLGMAPPMAPQMAPPMKKGGKVMKKAAGGMSRPLQAQRMPMRGQNAPIQAQRMPIRGQNAPQTRGPYGLDSRAIAADPAGYAKHLEGAKAQEALRPGSTFLSNSMKKGGKVMKKAAGGAAKLRRKSPMPDKIKMVNYPRGG